MTENILCVFRVVPPFSNSSGVMWTGLSFKETEKDYNAAKLKRLDQSPLLRCRLNVGYVDGLII